MYPLTPGESPENISKDYYSLAPIVMENPGIRNALTILYQKSQIDFVSERLPKDLASVVIWSFMAHHQGISLRDLLSECLKWLGGQGHGAQRLPHPQKQVDPKGSSPVLQLPGGGN
jgi:hypothetical protein